MRNEGIDNRAGSEDSSEFLLRRLALLCTAITAGIGWITIVGWVSDVRILASIRTDFEPMAPASAIGLILLSSVLFVYTRMPMHRHVLILSNAAMLFVILFSSITLIEFIRGIEPGIEQSLFLINDKLGAFFVVRMSPITAVNLILCPISLLLLLSPMKRLKGVASGIAVLVGLIGLITALGYLYGTPLLYGGTTRPMAFTATVAFMFFSIGLISAAGPQSWPLSSFMDSSTRAVLLIAFLPLVVVIILFEGWLIDSYEIFGINPAIWTAMIVIFFVILFSSVVTRVARFIGGSIDRANAEKENAIEALHKSEEQLRSVTQTAIDAIITSDSTGNIISWNHGAETMFGFSAGEIAGKPLTIIIPERYQEFHKNALKRVVSTGNTSLIGRSIEMRARRIEGSEFPVELSIATWKTKENIFFSGIIRDITKRKTTEDRKNLTLKILAMLGQSQEKNDTIRNILLLIKQFSKFEAVGIRLKEGDDYPYYDTIGFAGDFVGTERSLCAYDENGKLICDPDGHPLLECMCGNVIQGRTYPKLRFFSEGGSFWSNCTSELCETAAEELRKARIRNRCKGYESVALIPLRSGNKNIGLLQLNDRKKNMFTLDLIIFFEDLGASIGIAMEKKRAEDELRKHREHLEELVKESTNELRISREKEHAVALYVRNLIETSLDPLVTISKDGNIMDVNNATELVTGFSRDQLIGSDFSDYFTEPEKAREGYQEVFKKGFVRDYPLAIRHLSGKITDVLYNATVYKNEAGEIQGVFAAARDVTERKRAEKLTKLDEMRLQSLLKISLHKPATMNDLLNMALDEIVLLTDSKVGYIYYYNEEKQEFTLHAWSREVMESCSIQEKQTTYQLQKTGIWGEAVRQRKPIIVNDFLAPDPLKKGYPQGHTPLSRFMTLPVFRDDHIVAVVGVGNKETDYSDIDVLHLKQMMDSVWLIAERKRAEVLLEIAKDEAERANLAKTNFLHTMSHELRTPLNAIIGFSEMLKLKTSGELNEKQVRYLDNIQNGGTNLLNIISQILDVVQIEDGTLELYIEKISVPEIIDNVIAAAREKASSKNVVIEKNLDQQLGFIEADMKILKLVFTNLIDNAVKFSKKDGGTVVIKSIKDWDNARFSISDTGIGIKKEDMEKIFQKFTQLDSGINRKYGGTGIGLAVAKHLVELQGGRIWVESRYGEGTTFTFILPIVYQISSKSLPAPLP